MKVLKKKGQLAKTEDGEPVIVTSEGKGVKANNLVVVIWNMCDSISADDLIGILSEKSGETKEKLDGPIKKLIEDLVKLDLVEEVEKG